MTYVPLGPADVALAAALMLAPAVVDVALRLGLLRRIAVASARAVVQLGALGLLLGWVFSVQHPGLVAAMLLVMTLAAAQAAVARSGSRIPWVHVAAFASLATTTTLVGAVGSGIVIGAEPWWTPQYAIPLCGMLLGNALTGVSLSLDRVLGALRDHHDAIEARLALGASLWTATLPWVRDAVRSGMVPILNSMSVVGLVSLPGMMTGQILAGADPSDAVAYQLLILFMIASVTAMTTMALVVWCWWRLADPWQRLRVALIERAGSR